MKKQNLLFLLSSLLICSCTNPFEEIKESESEKASETISESESESVSEKKDALANVTFSNKTFEYDGLLHSLEVENLPEGATVAYYNNSQKVPGTYKVYATITYEGKQTKLNAKIIITKATSTLKADAIQTAYVVKGGVKPTFTLSNTSQSIEIKPVYVPGNYTYELYAVANDFYKESNHVIVKFNVLNGEPNSKITFDSASFKYNGHEQGIVCENIPQGYTVEYSNNKATEVGTYYASATIKNSENKAVKTLNAKFTIDNVANEEFDEYLDDFFVEYLGDDMLAWNIFTQNAEDFGFVREEGFNPKWYTYESIDASEYSQYYKEEQECYDLLKEFDKDTLSYEQQVSYNAIDSFFKYYVALYEPTLNYDFLMELNYVDQFGGYASEFNSNMEAYTFRKEQDIKDCLSYIKSLPEAFKSYDLYVSDRVKANYPLSDFTLEEMINYLDDLCDLNGKDFYLVEILQNKVDGVEGLDSETKSDYKAKIKTYINDYLIPAYSTLADNLEQYKGKCTKEGYLANYKNGEKLFELNLKKLLGIWDLDLEEYGLYLNSSVNTYSKAISSAAKKITDLYKTDQTAYKNAYSYVTGSPLTGLKDPVKMIDYLKTFAYTIVPELEAFPNITVKYMDDASAKVSNAVAYYLKSPLDNNDQEYITLNPEHMDDYNETLATMAHEGYPGHLYAYLFDKQLNISNIAKIMTSTAHGEGWATYVQLKLYEYMKDHNTAKDQNVASIACDYLYYNQLLGFPAYAYMDYLIHIKHYTIDQLATYMDGVGFNGDKAEDLYRTLIETPVTYAAYGYGMLFMLDLHTKAKKSLGNIYNEIDFNKALLSDGWCGLGRLEEVANEYVDSTLKLYKEYK